MSGTSALADRLAATIRSVGGHRDVWAVFEDAELFGAVVDALADALEPLDPTTIAGVESRGFLLGGAVAVQLEVGFTAIRKAGGPFPGEKTVATTEPDYRGNVTELRALSRSLGPGDRVALVDDWIETGSQALAVRDLVEARGAEFLGLATMVHDTSPEVAEAVPVVASLVDSASLAEEDE
ncbi:MAG: phosphoribosyltransferase family protein [Actinomycetota bacterium]